MSLNAAVALAFCQYLWRIVRLLPIGISTIETLFTLRSNPFLIARVDAIQAVLFLFLLAVFMWTVHIIVNFPTGALTVVSANKITFSPADFPTFNGSFVSMLHRLIC